MATTGKLRFRNRIVCNVTGVELVIHDEGDLHPWDGTLILPAGEEIEQALGYTILLDDGWSGPIAIVSVEPQPDATTLVTFKGHGSLVKGMWWLPRPPIRLP